MTDEIIINKKGKIISGKYLNGEILITENRSLYDGYYIYIWPKDGSKWPNTDKEMVYDYWMENKEWLKNLFKKNNWQIDWLE